MLCKHFGERPTITATPNVPRFDMEIPLAWWANIAVWAPTNQWVECLGIQLRAGPMQQFSAPNKGFLARAQRTYEIRVEVHNGRQEPIFVGLKGVGMDQRRATVGKWPMTGRGETVAPGTAASFTLRRDNRFGMAITATIHTGPALTAKWEPDHPRIAFLAPDLAETRAG